MKWCSVSQIWSKPSCSVHSICSSSRCTTSSWSSQGTAWKKKKVPKRTGKIIGTVLSSGGHDLRGPAPPALLDDPRLPPGGPVHHRERLLRRRGRLRGHEVPD